MNIEDHMYILTADENIKQTAHREVDVQVDLLHADTGANRLAFAWDYRALIPPYNNPNTVGSKILQGVNYASAASGILNETGTLFGQLFPLDEQIQNFGKTLEELNSLLGGDVGDYLKNSLYFVCVGNNDYLNNYLLPLSNKPKKYTPETFADLLLHHFNRQLKDLYNLRGMKFLITGLRPLGCIPEQIGNSGNTSSCVESTNHLASVFNSKLKAMLDQLNIDLDGSYFLYWDTYSSTLDVITNYSSYGPGHACSNYFGTKPPSLDIVRIFNFSNEVCRRILQAPFSLQLHYNACNTSFLPCSSDGIDDTHQSTTTLVQKKKIPAGRKASSDNKKSWKDKGFTSLIVAAPEMDVESIIEDLLPILSYYAPFAIYHQYLQIHKSLNIPAKDMFYFGIALDLKSPAADVAAIKVQQGLNWLGHMLGLLDNLLESRLSK
ncbi:uncharacterized protein A4U43_C01F15680 [Asparagus officinalis]|uniref:GDSL esterase/lipase n=1 Tax=Asparagus officinalis TaxID=4686 RepID=A0A5P1FU96_ASPOF|nr:uncharacterized protein A4U43_C01F15680 [Asparagus officinalis]